MSNALRPRGALAPPAPHVEPDTPAAHYTGNFDDAAAEAIGLAHVHEHAPHGPGHALSHPQPDTPPRVYKGWRRKGGKLGEYRGLCGLSRGSASLPR